MKCPRCQQDNPSHAKFCLACGVPFSGKDGPSAGSYTDLQRTLAEALEQQTATEEILRVISRSPTDLQPVLDTIARSAVRVCDATDALVSIRDGDESVTAAHYGDQEVVALGQRRPIIRGLVVGRALLEARPVQVEDITQTDEFPEGRAIAIRMGHRTVMAVPLLRDGVAIGGILMRRSAVKPFTDKQIAVLETFADQAVIAIENVRLFTELQEKNQALTQAHAQVTASLDQQTATSEILRVIGSSPTDARPVFETIARSGVSVCAALGCAVFVVDADVLRVAATHGVRPERPARFLEEYPIPLSAEVDSAQTIRDRRIFHLADIEHNPNATPSDIENARLAGYRTRLMVPMVRGDRAVGLIAVTRESPLPFPDQQIELLKTFADQAVIAIENVRLFNETKEALEQQTATAEILRVISSSPTDIQPVLDAVTATAARVCGATDALIMRVEGQGLRRVAHFGPIPLVLPAVRPLTAGSASGRAIVEGRTIHIHDILATDAARHYPEALPADAGAQWRTMLAVPLVREGAAIGAILIRRTEIRPFTAKQIQLLETFASQAVIAIENVRLFKELQATNRELTTALDQQTATSEILRAISSSLTDVQPVFSTIVQSGLRLLGGYSASMMLLRDDDCLDLVAYTSTSAGADASLVHAFPLPLRRIPAGERAVHERRAHAVEDIESAPDATDVMRETGRARGWRSNLFVPMVRDDVAIGLISITRREPGPFAADQIALLEIFGAQAVIAIENARLFKELEARTQELTRSVGELRALGEVGQTLSSTLDLETVLTTIVSRAAGLAGTDGGAIYEYDDAAEQFWLRAEHGLAGGLVAARRQVGIGKGEGAVGRLAVTREPIQITDIADEGAYQSPLRGVLLAAGVRSLLAVPLLREDRLIGGLVVNRTQPGEFASEVVDLLRTFATQSALAIQNARLFREIEQKSHELEAASRHKSEFLANMSHELRTPLNAIIGFSELLSERLYGDLNAKQEEYLKDIHASGQHLLSLINDILDLSKIEAGRMELEVTDFHLPTAIDNALTLIRERAIRHGITLHQQIDPRLAQIQGDERKIKQVLLNILSNAIKFTPEGGRIEIRANPVNGSVEVSVTDTGVGIAAEDQEAIFEEFRQVGTADKKVEGTGLGLALSRKFVELHGGRIWVQSHLGAGSTFTFTLPVLRG